MKTTGHSMPLSKWPKQDYRAWEQALVPGDLFDEPKIALWLLARLA